MSDRRRPMRRLADVLPEVAGTLGLDAELRHSRAMASWARIVEEHVPAAAGASSLLSIQPPALVVTAADAMVAQELRLRSSELLPAFERAPGGVRLLELRIVIRPSQQPGRDGRRGSGRV